MTTQQTKPAPTEESQVARPGAARTVGLIARREISTRMHGKAFRITSAITLVVIVGGLILIHALSGGSEKTSIGVAGGDAALDHSIQVAGESTGKSYDLRHFATAEEAQRHVEDGDVKGALVLSAGHYTAYFDKEGDPTLTALFGAAARQHAIATSLDATAQSQLQHATEASALTVHELAPPPADQGQRLVIAYAAVALLAASIMVSGQLIAQGVVEEKASRVVEILLATVSPTHLLWGKILGIGALAVGQLVVYAAAGLITAQALGMLSLALTAYSVIALSLVWFVLGFLFFGTLYAAAASLVSRQEEVASASAPLTILSMGMMYAGIFGVQFPDATWVKVLSYIPPFSATLQPMLVATVHASGVQLVLPIVLAIVICAVAVVLAGRIYRRSVLHAGARLSWRRALGR
ncbi:ABC transporter permease [Tsukamurella sp. 8F]|uniref:ABC transporter permease n=1 Tax=unclassified Tsukamurella TaxID=2633480 RepID=UPI0023BA3579|nr:MULTISPECIES: ABC transporter permease [unclassified Tsukamurella]MDF0529799.1 ABC transporter permease [Tsukamurella sp. 8J]MDF0586991.1 ABC transporter permease [Tsukamurella sp. 8F]